MTAKQYLELRQEEYFKKHGEYADLFSVIEEWMDDYALLKLDEWN